MRGSRRNEYQDQIHGYEPETVAVKIKDILKVLVLKDLSIEDEETQWEYMSKNVKIKLFEEFPYYLYKAVWDDDFQAIMWSQYENGETVLINYSMIEQYLVKYFGDPQTEDYKQDHNRLRHNLEEVFGFNKIPKQNLKHNRDRPEMSCFFNHLKNIGDGSTDPWVEYHHPDFFQKDNPHAEIPKGKNSKFFKLCQTLKMPYRLRKQDTNDKGKRRRSDRLIPGSDMGFGPFPGPMFRHTDSGPFGPDFHSHIAQMPPMPPMNLGKSYGLPDGLQNIQPLVDDSLDQESIDRALAESIDTNSLRENEMMSIGSPGGAHGSISASQREDHIIA